MEPPGPTKPTSGWCLALVSRHGRAGLMAAVVAAAIVLGSLGTLAGMALAGIPSHWWSAAVLISTVVGGGCAAVIAMPVIDMADTLSGTLRALETTTRTDHVTGLLARRAFFDDIARMPHDDAVVAVIDVDHFKAVNDRHGHAAGDTVLRDVGDALGQALPGATIGRIGGDEFAVCLAGTDSTGLDRDLRRALARIETQQVGHISCTHGVAVRRQGETLADCLKRADLALIAAKAERSAPAGSALPRAHDRAPARAR